ncbi:hypothetical protein SESBI_19855 [Sesbania bispinosa]|nr:hypothetical protein SESBI_19855 [Sesbania bispinosa]
MQVWGRGVTVDVKHGDKPREDVFGGVLIGIVVRAAISFAGARKKKCKRLEMMRSRNALTWRLQIWNSKSQN